MTDSFAVRRVRPTGGPPLICLQGGNEFSLACRDMDAHLVLGLDGPVVVTALAGRVGGDYARATANGVRHYTEVAKELDAGRWPGDPEVQVIGAPDVRTEEDAAIDALRSAALIVLPGGSPTRLMSALTETPAGAAVQDLVAQGGRVMGSSAGAMALGPWCVLPDRGMDVVPGLGVMPYVTVPHWDGDRPDWVSALDAVVPPGIEVLGIPEESGVLVQGSTLVAIGQRGTRLVRQQRDLNLDE